MGLFDGSWSGSRVWGFPCPRHLRRPRSEEPLKIPIARGPTPGLLPCMTWTAKFRTNRGMQNRNAEGYRDGVPWKRRNTCNCFGVAWVSQLVHPWQLTFVRMLCCGDPIDALPQGRRISAIPHLWGRPGLQFWCKLQPAGTILPEQGAVLTP